MVAALAVVVAVVVVSNLEGPNAGVAPASNGPSVVPLGSEYALVDVATGAMTGTGIVPAGSEVDASTDGTKITYVATSDVGDAIHVANADGSNVQAFEQTASPGGGLSAPRWSPDGTKIVYQDRGIGGHIGNLYVLDVTSGQVKQITHLPPLSVGLYYMAPMFSADGKSVLFTKPTVVASGADGQQLRFDIWTVPASGGEPTLVQRNARGVDVEPGGDSIAFVGLRVVNGEFKFGDLYIAGSNGQEARKLVDGEIGQARWSPDGSQIAYDDGGSTGCSSWTSRPGRRKRSSTVR